MFAVLASTENVSPWGVRVRTELPWRPDSRIFVKRSEGNAWMRARVAYCEALQGSHHALGLEFYGTAHRYNLTFRCPHCGRYEASANFRTDQNERDVQIKARIYRIQCSACGWRGEACGFSAVRILRYQSKEMHSPEEKALLAQWPPKQARTESKRTISLGLL